MKKVLTISNFTVLVKKHFYVFLLLLITLIFFSGLLSSSKILNNVHYINDMTFQSENMLEYISGSGELPLWTPYFYSGQPFLAIPEHYLFDLNFLYILLFKNIFFAMNLAVISYFFLAGLGMYLLVYEIIKKQNVAFIASLIFMFNGLMHDFILGGHLNILESYALMPFVFYFTYKALNKKTWLNNSIIAALFLSMMIYAGGIIFFLYVGLIIGAYMVWNLLGSNFGKKLTRTILVSLIITSLLFGLSALKLLPVLEFTDMSSRGAGVSYQEYLGEPIKLNNIWTSMINVLAKVNYSGAIGITSFVLLLFGLLSLRKKIVIFSVLLILLSVLLATGTFVAKLFYLIPGFGQMRHIERALVLFVFTTPIIAAFGFNNLTNFLRKYKQNLKEGVVFSVVVLLLVVELIFLQKFPDSVDVISPNDIPTLNEINKDSEIFRIANYGLSTPIGASGYNYFIQLGIPSIKGGGGIWINEYVQYLSVAQQLAPSKLFGILNGKYIISDREIDDSGLSLIGEFQDCKDCPIWETYGPYLYENKNFVPRAFLIDNSIVIVGNKQDKIEFAYGLLIENLDPLSTVVIEGKDSLSEYVTDELNKFNSIILLRNSADQNDFPKLKRYQERGGKLLPNLLEEEYTLNSDDLADALSSETDYYEMGLDKISVNEFALELNGKKGWLVLSERFAHFPGWKATINGKQLQIHKANNVISAVYLNGEDGTLSFEYSPDSFRKGKLITITTILILLLYGLYIIYSRFKNAKN